MWIQNSIRHYLDDILQIQHQIEDLKARAKEIAFRAKDESFVISSYFKDEEFKNYLCDDFVEKVKCLQDRVNNLYSIKMKNIKICLLLNLISV